MQKRFFLLFLFSTFCCGLVFSRDTRTVNTCVIADTTIFRCELIKMYFGGWKSTNKQNGTMSYKDVTFQAKAGDILTFDWKTSTEEYCDKFAVAFDGVYVLTKSGEDSGIFKYVIEQDGSHTLKLIYSKDYFSSAGDDEVNVSNIVVSICSDSIMNINVEDFYISDALYIESGNTSRVEAKLNYYAQPNDTLRMCCKPACATCGTRSYYQKCDKHKSNNCYTKIRPINGEGNVTVKFDDLYSCSHYYYEREVYSYVTITRPLQLKEMQCLDVIDGETKMEIKVKNNVQNLCLCRNFSNTNWQALYLPFSLSYNDWKDDFDVAKINNVNMYDTNGDGEIDETVLEILIVNAGTLKPNHPYLIKAKTKGEKTIRIANATLYPTVVNPLDVSSAEMKFTFVGTYEGVSGEEMVENQYYALAGGALAYTEDTNVSLKPYRWYMKAESRDGQVILPSANNSRIRVKVFGEDGIETGIEELETEETISENNAVYSLDGRLVGKNGTNGLRPGIYISNGKKVLVK